MSAATFQPVAPNERIATLDVLRGLALLGMGAGYARSLAQQDRANPQPNQDMARSS